MRIALVLCALLCSCAGSPTFPPAAPATGKRPPPAERDFRASDLAKSDIDVVAETAPKESIASARLLMEKLYRRNPREWRKGNYASMDEALARAFDPRLEFRFPELGQARGADAIVLALKPDYSGDRVFAFGVGMASMIFSPTTPGPSSTSPIRSIRRNSTTRHATSRSRPGSSPMPGTHTGNS